MKPKKSLNQFDSVLRKEGDEFYFYVPGYSYISQDKNADVAHEKLLGQIAQEPENKKRGTFSFSHYYRSLLFFCRLFFIRGNPLSPKKSSHRNMKETLLFSGVVLFLFITLCFTLQWGYFTVRTNVKDSMVTSEGLMKPVYYIFQRIEKDLDGDL